MMTHLQRLRGWNEAMEFALLPISVTKNALRGLRAKAGGDLGRARPMGGPTQAMYIAKGSSTEEVGEALRQYGLWDGVAMPKGLKSIRDHSVVIPRMPVKMRRQLDEAERMAGIRRKMTTPADAQALHEHGHAVDSWASKHSSAVHNAVQRAGGSGERMGEVVRKVVRGRLRVETRANRNVLREIERVGSPGDAATWRRWANAQIKHGHRRPALSQIAAGEGVDTRAKMKAFLRQRPEFRSGFTDI